MWRRKIGTWLGLRSRNVAASPRGQGGMEVSRTIHSGANMKNSKKCPFIVKHWVGSLLRFFSLFLASSWKGSLFNDVMVLWVRQVYWWPLRYLQLAKGFPNGMSYRTVLRGPQHCLAMCQRPLKVCPGDLCLLLQRPWKKRVVLCLIKAWEYPAPEDSSVRMIYFRFISWKMEARHPPQHSAAPLWTGRLSMQWSSGHHPDCSWIRFLKHFVIYLIEVVDVFRCVQNIFICSPVCWKKSSVSTGDPQPVSSSKASCIDRGKARAERVVSIAFQSYSKEWYHWGSSARAVSWPYFWCWLTQSLDSCSLVEGGSLSYFHGVYICILSRAGFQSSTVSLTKPRQEFKP